MERRMNIQKVIGIVMLAVWVSLSLPVPAEAAAAGGETADGSNLIRVHTDQSLLIDCKEVVKRVSIAKPEIADVTVVSPKQLMIIGKLPGETTLVSWNGEEVATLRDIRVDADEERIREELEKIAPGEPFGVTASGDSLILSGSVSDNNVKRRLEEAAGAFAKNVINLVTLDNLEQILLQIRVSEINRTRAKELGFNLIFEQNTLRGSVSPGNAFSPFFGNLRLPPVGPDIPFSDAMNIFVAKPGAFPKFAGFLRVLEDKGALKTLAEPNLVVANGGEGRFLVGGEFPVVFNTTAGGTSSFSIVYKEFGVRLNFQPRIMENGEIHLKVYQEVSSLDFANAVVLTGFRIPALTSRKAESVVQLADGQSFVVAGLLDTKVEKQISKIPLLGDIPVLGALFRNTRYKNDETELMVLVTPKIVRPLKAEEIPALPTERIAPEETAPDMIPMLPAPPIGRNESGG